jgi:EmrB/QacA subfamily drug resistance transporter
VFVTVALALMMFSVDSTIVAAALRPIQTGLHVSVNWTGWTITAYSLGLVIMLPISGTLSERYGRRRVFLACTIIFTVASLCCGLANDIYLLIVLRALQAAGGAGLTPSATGIIVDHFGEARDRAVGLFGSIFPIGAMIGPSIGGFLVASWSWRGAFLVNVPLGVATVLLALRFVPRDRPHGERVRVRLDVVGMAVLGVGLACGMLAVSYLGEPGARADAPAFLALVAASAVAVWLFVRHINHTAHPLIAPRLIYGPSFGVVNLINLVYSGVRIGIIALVPLYAANRYGLDAFAASTLMIPQGAAGIVFSFVSTLRLRRTGYRQPLYLGCTIVASGILMLAIHPPGGFSPYLWLACSTFLIGIGSGTVSPASRNAGLQLAPQHSSSLAGMRTMFMQIGTIATVSIATALLAAAGHPGSAQAWFYAATAAVLAVFLPTIGRVPEHRGSW